LLISVHLPKTAGSSLLSSLEDHFGSKLLRDYEDFPINKPVYERNRYAFQASLDNAEKNFDGIECIHGHFLPAKYLLLSNRRNVEFVTWMRDPVERVLSHYYFWRREYNPENSPPLHKKIVEEDWSLERFCFSEELKDFYTQFLFAFPLEYFSFIGITEHYDEDFAFFSQHYLGTSLPPKRVNIGFEGKRYPIDEHMRWELKVFHSRDVRLYERALEMRKQRISKVEKAAHRLGKWLRSPWKRHRSDRE